MFQAPINQAENASISYLPSAVKPPVKKRLVKKRAALPKSRRPYAFPRLLGETDCSDYSLDIYCQSAMSTAFEVTRGSRDKCGRRAARERIAGWRLTPSTIAAMARTMYDYNTKQPWPSGEAEHKPVEWLSVGAGCTARTGSARDAHMAAWDVMYAAMSILVEVPIEHPEDEAALLSTLIYTNWRVPTYQRQRVARRFARYVSNCIEGERFVPTSD